MCQLERHWAVKMMERNVRPPSLILLAQGGDSETVTHAPFSAAPLNLALCRDGSLAPNTGAEWWPLPRFTPWQNHMKTQEPQAEAHDSIAARSLRSLE